MVLFYMELKIPTSRLDLMILLGKSVYLHISNFKRAGYFHIVL